MGILDGKIALVTGASRGIGAGIAERFANEGAVVVVTARTERQEDSRLPGTIRDTAEAIRSAGGTALPIRADLTKPDDRRQLIEETRSTLGEPDILVNNAAVSWFVPVDGFPDSKLRIMFEVQVLAAFDLARGLLPAMRERQRGWILNISSGAARHALGPPFPLRRRAGTVYGMCKAAVERFTTGLAAEVYDDGIAVNALSPSFIVATPGVLLHDMMSDPAVEDVDSVEDIAEAALILCSGDPKLLTGRIAYSRELLEEFRVRGDRPSRVLQTVLFVDVESSTNRVAQAGDEQWRRLLDALDRLAEQRITQHQGWLVKSTGDGVLATFESPAQGVRCADDLVQSAGKLGLRVRAGLHTGEVELRGEDIAGIAVHLAHRVCEYANAGSVLVSRTLVDLVFGSDLEFVEIGERELRGVPGRWGLYELKR